MFYSTSENDHGLPHDPFKALVAPRPIGWITAISAKGEVNLSPYSFFNAVSDRPHMVAFSSQGRKDALTFIEETGEFVCNFATFDLREKVNATSAPLPRGDNEMVHAGLTAAPSRIVRPPRVAEAPAALECKWLRTVPLDPARRRAAALLPRPRPGRRHPHRRALHRERPRRDGRHAPDHAGGLPRLFHRRPGHEVFDAASDRRLV